MSKTVVVGMSGGVDSSVSIALLKEQGFNVIGLFMKNWEEEDEFGVCQASKEFEDVASVCEKLDVPYYSVDFISEYWDNVFSHFLREYKMGHTPNPDILCNREIKFKVFFEKAMELGADYLATGHYCQIEEIDGTHYLKKGKDPGKDQSYFLGAINGEVLDRVLFPIGGLLKSEVRQLAEKYDLSTKSKKDSTGICFIGERNFKNFLGNYLTPKSGEFKTLNGEVVGAHSGHQFYTLGQRKGLGLGGQGEPWFVVSKDIESNVVYVERGNHPAMFSDELVANEFHLINKVTSIQAPEKLNCKIRYRQQDQECVITKVQDGRVWVSFSTPQRAITPRQTIVFYRGDICIGSAMIEKAGENYHSLGKELPEII